MLKKDEQIKFTEELRNLMFRLDRGILGMEEESMLKKLADSTTLDAMIALDSPVSTIRDSLKEQAKKEVTAEQFNTEDEAISDILGRKNKAGLTPIDYAKNLDIACYLISVCGADPQGKCSLHYKQDPAIVYHAFLSYGVDYLNKLDNGGNSPLHLAIERQDNEMVAELIRYGADIDQKNSKGESLLHLAIRHEIHPDIIEFLTEQCISDVPAIETLMADTQYEEFSLLGADEEICFNFGETFKDRIFQDELEYSSSSSSSFSSSFSGEFYEEAGEISIGGKSFSPIGTEGRVISSLPSFASSFSR